MPGRMPGSTTVARPAAPPRRLPGGVAGQLLPLVPLVAVAALLAVRWESLPARFPVHWNAAMEPDGWATRSVLGVFGPLVFAALMIGFMGPLSWAIVRWSPRRHAVGTTAAAAEAEHQRLTLRILRVVQWTMGLLFAAAGLLPLAHAAGSSDLLARAIVALGLGLAVLLPAYLLVILWRRRGAATGAGDGTPDARWTGGLVYWNPEDPAVFVEKRFGIGYTLNFARPAAWLALALLAGVPILLAWLLVAVG